MIPKVAGSGQSFEGAGQYYLHDKLESQRKASEADRLGDYMLHDKNGQQTSFRVGFTSMLNMAADTPQQAIAQMTASYERYRQREANKRGRKLEKPVYAYSLAWAPDETPSRFEMMSAVRSSLKALRLDGLQTLIVQHTDEPHPHIHVIVNRIELDGSRARNIPFDHLRFSRWAEQYERDHGGIRCEQRVANNELRRQGVMVRDTVSLSRTEVTARERLRNEVYAQQREAAAFRLLTQGAEVSTLLHQHAEELRMLERETRERMISDRHASRRHFAPQWRTVYAQQKDMALKLKTANDGGILERACFIFTKRELLRKGGRLGLKEVAKLALSSRRLSERVERIHALERAELAASQKRHLEQSQRDAWNIHAEALKVLRLSHQKQTEQLRDTLRKQSKPPERHSQSTQESKTPLSAPNLGKGQELSPDEISHHLRKSRLVRDVYRKASHPKPDQLQRRDGSKSTANDRRPKRDRGLDYEQ